MSYHLLKDYDMALKILEEFRRTQQVRNMILQSDGQIVTFDNLNLLAVQFTAESMMVFQDGT